MSVNKSGGAAGVRPSRDENVAKLRAQQNRSLGRMMDLVAQGHPHYQQIFRQHGLSPSDFRTAEDLRKLPLTRKTDWMADPDRFRMRLDGIPGLSLEETTIADIIYTTGSTGKPTPFYDTMHDRFARILHMKRVTQIAGIGPGDVVMNLFPLSSIPHQGFLSAMWGSQSVGARLVSGMTGREYPDFPIHNRMDHSIMMIERDRATVIWGIATYVRRLVMRAQELGKDFSSVRLAMVMGEPCPDGMRADIIARLKSLGSADPKVNNGYGFTEGQAPAVQCCDAVDMHFGAPEQYFLDVIDPKTEQPVPDGEKGMLSISHLNRRGTVLLRYVVGDMVVMTHETCARCGLTGPRFTMTPYRADGLFKVKGTLINPASIHDKLAQILTDGVTEYQVVITKEVADDPYSTDALMVRLACNERERERLERAAKSLVSSAVEITPKVEFLPEDAFSEIARGYKFKRFVDERKKQ
ncbi:MAG: phenylacetate--CoA ligase [SAR202 cluster bacterium]|nr:phenylacetate--CoA ligase [SAR202 cluster bacterium]